MEPLQPDLGTYLASINSKAYILSLSLRPGAFVTSEFQEGGQRFVELHCPTESHCLTIEIPTAHPRSVVLEKLLPALERGLCVVPDVSRRYHTQSESIVPCVVSESDLGLPNTHHPPREDLLEQALQKRKMRAQKRLARRRGQP